MNTTLTALIDRSQWIHPTSPTRDGFPLSGLRCNHRCKISTAQDDGRIVTTESRWADGEAANQRPDGGRVLFPRPQSGLQNCVCVNRSVGGEADLAPGSASYLLRLLKLAGKYRLNVQNQYKLAQFRTFIS